MVQNRLKLSLTLAGVAAVVGTLSAVGTGMSFAANRPGAGAPCAVPSRYATIQAAVADPGCTTVKVAPGTYHENVVIDRSLTLSGAKAGKDARTRRAGGDSVIDGGATNATITIKANNVTVDGFILNGPQNDGQAAFVMQEHNSGETIQNNLVNNPGRAASITAGKTVFRNNVVRNTSTATDGFQANSGPVNGLTISGNTFSGADSSRYNADVTIINGDTGVVVADNRSTRDGTLVALFFTHGARVTGNTVVGSSNSSAVYIGGSTHDTTVSGNTISGAGSAVKTAGSQNSAVTVTRNTLRNNGYGVNVAAGSTTDTVLVNRNTITGNTTYGVFNGSAPAPATNATCNWWGALNGPGPVGPGRGDKISTGVTYRPWLLLPNLAVVCR
jgi:hypothetical protein